MSSLSNRVDESFEEFRAGRKQVSGLQTGRSTILLRLGLRGFLECRTFSVETKKVLGKQDKLITLDIDQEFCVDHVHQTSTWKYQEGSWKYKSEATLSWRHRIGNHRDIPVAFKVTELMTSCQERREEDLEQSLHSSFTDNREMSAQCRSPSTQLLPFRLKTPCYLLLLSKSSQKIRNTK